MAEPFANVEFKDMHPAEAVAEHEVLMAFLADSDAVFFREWWYEEGAAHFNDWLSRQGKKLKKCFPKR
jgi:glutamine synthetase type III